MVAKRHSYAKYMNFFCSDGSQVLATNNLQHAKPNGIKWHLDKFDLAVHWLLIAKGSILINSRMRLITYLLVIPVTHGATNI